MLIKKLDLPTKIELEQFISVQAHDLRSPFNQVIGFGKMLINTIKDEPLSDMQKEDLNTVYRGAMRSLNLVNALIDIARFNRDEKTAFPAETDIEKLMEHCLAQWKKFHPGDETAIQIRNLLPSTKVYLDEMLTQQLIIGTIAYVALFCEPKATVQLTVEEDAGGTAFTFASQGTKAQFISEMDLEMLGYVNRACVEVQKGTLPRAEENDDGALIQFIIPGK
jgi:signal transduction histidine kinase